MSALLDPTQPAKQAEKASVARLRLRSLQFVLCALLRRAASKHLTRHTSRLMHTFVTLYPMSCSMFFIRSWVRGRICGASDETNTFK